MWLKKHKTKLIAALVVIAVLAAAFYIGGDSPSSKGWETGDDKQEDNSANGTSPSPDNGADDTAGDGSNSSAPGTSDGAVSAGDTTKADQSDESNASGMVIDPATGKDKYLTDPVPDGKPIPVEPQDVTIGSAAYTCTISISCATVLDNITLCDKDKVELIPADGWILKPVTVTFYEGESVFNLLQRVCKQQKIHMEFENTPIYNSAYIEGINNLYEFDVGALSGWMYSVNDWFPNYGCSRYALRDGDVICWLYTCNLGQDVGGGYAVGNK